MSRTGRATMSSNGSPPTTEAGQAATACPARTAANRSSKPVIRAPIRGGPSAVVGQRPEVARHRVHVVDPDDRLVHQVARVELLARGQGVVGRQDRHAGIREQRLADQALGGERQPDQGDVGPVVAQATRGVVEREVADGQENLGTRLRKRPQQPRGEIERGGGEQSDVQLAALAASGLDRGLQRLIDALEQTGDPLQQCPAGRGQLDLARGADEQLRPDERLELPDLGAERLLGEVQALRGAGEVELLGDGGERTQVTQLHTHNARW